MSQEERGSISTVHEPKGPFSANFLDKDEAAGIRRKTYFKIFIGSMVITTLAMYAIFSIYWGALYKAPTRNLEGWLVDFDGDQVGQTVVQGLTGAAGSAGKVTWIVHPASDFPNGPSDLAQKVIDEKTWVAIAINPAATNNLRTATQSADSSYNGTRAITAYGNEARSENAYRALVRSSIEAGLQQITQRFAAQYIQSLASNSTQLSAIAQRAPTILSQPVSYTIQNLRPFDVPVATAVTFVGLIYLLILSFFIVNAGAAARQISGLERDLTLGSLIRVRMISTIVAYFFISLLYSALSPAFGLPTTRTFGHAGFVVFWMVNYCGMMSVGLALEAMLALLTIRFIPYFMLTWIVSNVSVCFLPIEVLPGIFKYGYGFPFYNVSKAVRTIVFGTRNELGLNFGILIAWTALSCITFPLFQWVSRRRDVAAARAAAAKKNEEEKEEL